MNFEEEDIDLEDTLRNDFDLDDFLENKATRKIIEHDFYKKFNLKTYDKLIGLLTHYESIFPALFQSVNYDDFIKMVYESTFKNYNLELLYENKEETMDLLIDNYEKQQKVKSNNTKAVNNTLYINTSKEKSGGDHGTQTTFSWKNLKNK